MKNYIKTKPRCRVCKGFLYFRGAVSSKDTWSVRDFLKDKLHCLMCGRLYSFDEIASQNSQESHKQKK